MRYCCHFLLDNCRGDLEFINSMIDKTAIARLEQVGGFRVLRRARECGAGRAAGGAARAGGGGEGCAGGGGVAVGRRQVRAAGLAAGGRWWVER